MIWIALLVGLFTGYNYRAMKDSEKNLEITKQFITNRIKEYKLGAPESFAFTCHVCFRKRPDTKISVYKHELSYGAGAKFNIRYCNDKASCVLGAPDVAKYWEGKE